MPRTNLHGTDASGAHPDLHAASQQTLAQPQPITPEQQSLDSLSPGYVLEWADQQRDQRCTRQHLASATDLRGGISSQGEKEGGAVHRLLVLRELFAEYVDVLRDVLGVDARFVEAHVARRRYRSPMGRRGRDGCGGGKGVVCLEYPELFTVARGASVGVGGSDGVGEVPSHAISNNGDIAVFCRASLWLGPTADVLLLDCPAWSHPSDFRKARYPSRGSGHAHSLAGRVKGADSSNLAPGGHSGADDEIPSFETLLYESLVDEWRGESNDEIDVRSLVEDIAVHQWTEFFEAISMDLVPSAPGTTALFSEAQRSLERNLSSSELYERSLTHPHPLSSTSAWESLLSRLNRRVSLLNYLTPNSNLIPTPSHPSLTPKNSHPTPATHFSSTAPTTGTTSVIASPALPLRRRRRHQRPRTSGSARPSRTEEQNQHALDRVSYMGGVLLPVSVVSSVLSMSDPFGPTGPLFYVFWAAAAPLVAVAVLVIYADSIRKAEVWIEVASSGSGGGGSSSPSGEVDKNGNRVGVGVGRDGLSAGGRRPGVSGEKPSPSADLDVDLESQALPYGVAALKVEDEEEMEGEEEEEHESDASDEPAMMVEKLFPNAGAGSWKKEQLGWAGACKAMFRIYKLKKGRPPSWARNIRHERGP